MRGAWADRHGDLPLSENHDFWRDVSLRQLLRNVSSMSLSATIPLKCLGAAFPGDKRPMDQRPLVSGKQLAQTVQVSA